MVDITKNYFELFQIPVACHVDAALLAECYRELQKSVHPDRFVGADKQQQRLAIQYAAYVNEAFDTLKSPVKRALYQLKLAGFDVDLENNTVMDPMFLMEQMELREAMSEVRDHSDPEAELERLVELVDAGIEVSHKQFEQLWLSAHAEQVTSSEKERVLKAAQDAVRKMQFMVKLASELEQLESELLD